MTIGSGFNLLPGRPDNIHIQQVIFYNLAEIRHHRRKCQPPCCGGFRLTQSGGNRMLRDIGRGVKHGRHHAEIHGVVGNGLKIERHAQFHFKSGGVENFLALGKTIGFVGPIAIAENESVERQLGVNMGFAVIGLSFGRLSHSRDSGRQ